MVQAIPLMRAGKHVLAEKPLAANAREARIAFAVARERGVVLMEGLRTLRPAGSGQGTA